MVRGNQGHYRGKVGRRRTESSIVRPKKKNKQEKDMLWFVVDDKYLKKKNSQEENPQPDSNVASTETNFIIIMNDEWSLHLVRNKVFMR